MHDPNTKEPLLSPEVPPKKEWPTLVPLDSPALPEFDLSLLPTWAGSFAKALSQHTETPPALAGSMVLGNALF